MKPITDHDEIVKKCLELDKKSEQEGIAVYYLSASRNTYRLVWNAVSWSMLSEGERYSMVRYGNLFLSVEEAEAALKRLFEE
jgi:hypothetical protein